MVVVVVVFVFVDLRVEGWFGWIRRKNDVTIREMGEGGRYSEEECRTRKSSTARNKRGKQDLDLGVEDIYFGCPGNLLLQVAPDSTKQEGKAHGIAPPSARPRFPA